MRQIFLIWWAVACLIGFDAAAKKSKNYRVKIPLQMAAGQKANISYTHAKPVSGKVVSGKLTAILEVTRGADDNFILQWSTESLETDTMKIDKSSPLAGSLLLGVQLPFEVDSDGMPTKVHNKQKLLSDLRNNEVLASFDNNVLNSVIKFYDNMSDEALAMRWFEVPSAMSLCQDTNLKLGKKETSEGFLPSPFNNYKGQIRAKESIELLSVDMDNNQAHILYQLEMNPDDIDGLIGHSMKELVGDESAPEKLKGNIASIRKKADCIVDMKSGWVVSFAYSLTINDGNETSVNTFDAVLEWADQHPH